MGLRIVIGLAIASAISFLSFDAGPRTALLADLLGSWPLLLTAWAAGMLVLVAVDPKLLVAPAIFAAAGIGGLAWQAGAPLRADVLVFVAGLTTATIIATARLPMATDNPRFTAIGTVIRRSVESSATDSVRIVAVLGHVDVAWLDQDLHRPAAIHISVILGSLRVLLPQERVTTLAKPAPRSIAIRECGRRDRIQVDQPNLTVSMHGALAVVEFARH